MWPDGIGQEEAEKKIWNSVGGGEEKG